MIIKNEVARNPGGGEAGLINGLGGSFERPKDAIDRTFWQRQRERDAKAGARSEACQMTRGERLQRSAQYSAASSNLRAEAATLPDDAARPLLALARSYQDRARLFAEGRV
jgi:hypothetical protein